MSLALILLACGPSPEEALRAALVGDLPVEEALDLCDRAGESSEECVATVVRGHADVPLARCARLQSTRWRSECAFGISEARAKAGDRWGALDACGQAGAYYNECLYHAWTFELQLAADGLGRAVDGLERARPIIAYWSSIETIGDGAEELLWADWWYFAHARNRPASLAWCGSLADPTDRRRCEDGTRTYVRRSVVEALVRAATPADTKDRMCRGTPADALALLGDLYIPDPTLDTELVAGLAAGCAPGNVAKPEDELSRDRGEAGLVPTSPRTRDNVERPWNPVFRARGAPG